jgi:hypothetical protein
VSGGAGRCGLPDRIVAMSNVSAGPTILYRDGRIAEFRRSAIVNRFLEKAYAFFRATFGRAIPSR